jgi:hypothetical protein
MDEWVVERGMDEWVGEMDAWVVVYDCRLSIFNIKFFCCH